MVSSEHQKKFAGGKGGLWWVHGETGGGGVAREVGGPGLVAK